MEGCIWQKYYIREKYISDYLKKQNEDVNVQTNERKGRDRNFENLGRKE